MHTAADEIVLVRHGETTGESSIRYNGRTDVPLSDMGIEQMRRAGRALQDEHYDRLIVSPLMRSHHAGHIVSGASRGLTPNIVFGLREIDFGRWEGLTAEEIKVQDPTFYAQWRNSPGDFQFPDGESRNGFRERIVETTQSTLEPLTGTTLAVLHKGVIKTILVTLANLDPSAFQTLEVELGSIHRLRRDVSGWRLIDTGLVDHLGGLRQTGT
jgi:broad specificity phosphatase PhoE